jgi:hypothetical protein
MPPICADCSERTKTVRTVQSFSTFSGARAEERNGQVGRTVFERSFGLRDQQVVPKNLQKATPKPAPCGRRPNEAVRSWPVKRWNQIGECVSGFDICPECKRIRGERAGSHSNQRLAQR